MSIASYDELARWQSTAGVGPTLRGRRAEGTAPRIHFLSGNGFCGGVYWPMLQRFVPQHALFTHDIEGHGDSGKPAHFSGVRAVVRRIPQVMADQGLVDRPMIGMGHSFGGALTLCVAAQQPALFKALVLLDPIIMPPPVYAGIRIASMLGRHPMSKASRRRRMTWESREAVATHLRGRGTYKGWTEEAFQCFVEYATHDENGQRVLSCPREVEADIFEHPVYPWPAFRKIRVPTLILRGEQSFSFFPWAERLAKRANPLVTVKTLPGGHCFMQEDPAAAHAAVAAFLASL